MLKEETLRLKKNIIIKKDIFTYMYTDSMLIQYTYTFTRQFKKKNFK